MRTHRHTWALIVVLAAGFTGCSSTSPSLAASAPPEPPAGAAVLLSPEELASGRKLYTGKCARCHKFYDPAAYSPDEWRTWMDKMSRKAKLQPDQKDLLMRYLETFRSKGAAVPEKR